MMLKQIVTTVLAIVVVAGVAAAQTATPPQEPAPASTSTTTQGAFDKLSPGNQKIARALFEAQVQQTSTTPGSPAGTSSASSTSSTSPSSLSLDEIAAMKQSGKGWGEVFHEMKTQGLVEEKNLGQVIKKFNQQHRASSSGTLITTGSGRSQAVGPRGKPDSGVKGSRGHFDDEASTSARGPSGDHSGRGSLLSGPGHGYGHSGSSRPGISAGHSGKGGGHGIGRGK